MASYHQNDISPVEMSSETGDHAPRNSSDQPAAAAAATTAPPAELPSPETPTAPEDPSTRAFNDVLQSEIGVSTLLNRLKQSIASARDFAVFLKKRSALEEEQAQGLKKLCRTTHEATRRPDNRQGSYARQFDEVTRIHDRMADNGNNFALALHQMHEDLTDLAATMEKGRKTWKQNSIAFEKRAQDSESVMDKAKAKYDSLAEDYDRARSGDKGSGKIFGRKGPKQLEDDLHRKLQAADQEYAARVQTAGSHRQELLNRDRPEAVRRLQDLINECDSALTLQLQKFASFNEKLILSNGLCVRPLNQAEGQGSQASSLRDAAFAVDNDKDLRTYVLSFTSKVPQKPGEIKYQKHHTLAASQQQVLPTANRQSQQFTPPHQQMPSQAAYLPGGMASQGQPPGPAAGPGYQEHMRGSSAGYQQPPERAFTPTGAPHQQSSAHPYPTGPSNGSPYTPVGPSNNLPPMHTDQYGATPPHMQQSNPPSATGAAPNNGQFPTSDAPLTRPVFGVTLDKLFQRDGSAVPMPVYQCIQAVDLFGLEVEGIYRLSGTTSHINSIKAMFDQDASRVDFRNPENFFHDVNSVAGALKQFFRELPDPLLTSALYKDFIDAARIEDDTLRRDSMHAIINSLPDSNYATLRALSLHLNRVQERSSINRMNANNLAICFSPTLMGQSNGPNIADAGWQLRVVDTILKNTYQIFDDD